MLHFSAIHQIFVKPGPANPRQRMAFRALLFIYDPISLQTGLAPEKRHPHVVKHSLASHLVAGNATLALIPQALGHRSSALRSHISVRTKLKRREALQRALMGLF
jgi:site-specific recombinase XerD